MCLFRQGPPRRPLPKAFFCKDYRDTNRSSHCRVEQWRSRLSGMMAQRPYGTMLSETPDPGATTLTQAATVCSGIRFIELLQQSANTWMVQARAFVSLPVLEAELKAKSCRALLWVPLQEGVLPCLLQILLALVFLGVWKQFSRESLHQHMVSPHSSPPPPLSLTLFSLCPTNPLSVLICPNDPS